MMSQQIICSLYTSTPVFLTVLLLYSLNCFLKLFLPCFPHYLHNTTLSAKFKGRLDELQMVFKTITIWPISTTDTIEFSVSLLLLRFLILHCALYSQVHTQPLPNLLPGTTEQNEHCTVAKQQNVILHSLQLTHFLVTFNSPAFTVMGLAHQHKFRI